MKSEINDSKLIIYTEEGHLIIFYHAEKNYYRLKTNITRQCLNRINDYFSMLKHNL